MTKHFPYLHPEERKEEGERGRGGRRGGRVKLDVFEFHLTNVTCSYNSCTCSLCCLYRSTTSFHPSTVTCS